MHRCLELAALGRGHVAPNPLVGAVLVHEDRIIGEGYHRQYGGPHAEVNCIDSVREEDRRYINLSTLYVSLEPCAHFGKTPPCADLIIRMNIPKIVIGCRDPFFQVDGKGIEKLKAAGRDVTLGVLEAECKTINKRFFTYHTLHRPYVILKWAQSMDGKIAGSMSGGGIDHKNRLHISNEYSSRMVHKWRGEEMSIMIGTRTAFLDDPLLNTRLWPGRDPVRLVVDMDLELPGSLRVFQTPQPTVVFNLKKHTVPDKPKDVITQKEGPLFYQVAEDTDLVHQVINALYQMNVHSVLVEGGAYLLQSFIDAGLWDEARVITNEEMIVGSGLNAPVLVNHELEKKETFFSDVIRYFRNSKIN
jgi:diaminohydroxyphosphoribosylaminopyrimidine deaminase/5-amino-6-(5-phosphoribosylamino)uracil reductase